MYHLTMSRWLEKSYHMHWMLCVMFQELQHIKQGNHPCICIRHACLRWCYFTHDARSRPPSRPERCCTRASLVLSNMVYIALLLLCSIVQIKREFQHRWPILYSIRKKRHTISQLKQTHAHIELLSWAVVVVVVVAIAEKGYGWGGHVFLGLPACGALYLAHSSWRTSPWRKYTIVTGITESVSHSNCY